jgi:pimeloyl-ACP methyl ester carboxylesterase
VRVATFVLVPGAWLGGWAWREVARDLRRRGHDVYPVTLTGLGERVHLARPDVDLETHITDVANLLEYEDLRDVVLAGHSYAGAVVTGVADRAGDRLAQLVYVDSGPLQDGQSLYDLFDAEGKTQVERAVATYGQGWLLPFPPFEVLETTASVAGLDERARALMAAKATPQPFATYQQPLRLTNGDAGSYRRTVIACDDFRALVAAEIPPILALTQPPWHLVELATGHWPMLSAPGELAALLDRLSENR